MDHGVGTTEVELAVMMGHYRLASALEAFITAGAGSNAEPSDGASEDPKSGKVYFYHEDGEVIWDRPVLSCGPRGPVACTSNAPGSVATDSAAQASNVRHLEVIACTCARSHHIPEKNAQNYWKQLKICSFFRNNRRTKQPTDKPTN